MAVENVQQSAVLVEYLEHSPEEDGFFLDSEGSIDGACGKSHERRDEAGDERDCCQVNLSHLNGVDAA